MPIVWWLKKEQSGVGREKTVLSAHASSPRNLLPYFNFCSLWHT